MWSQDIVPEPHDLLRRQHANERVDGLVTSDAIGLSVPGRGGHKIRVKARCSIEVCLPICVADHASTTM